MQNDKTITAGNLIRLAMKIGYRGKPGQRGWKAFLKQRFGFKHHSNVTAWINRGVPGDFKQQLVVS